MSEPTSPSPDKTHLTDRPLGAGLWHLGRFIVLTQLLHTTLILVDMYWVGQIGGRGDPIAGRLALAAVGVAGTVIWSVTTLVIGLVTGMQAIVSRLIGDGRREEANRALTQGTVLMTLTASALSIVGYFLAKPLLGLLHVPTEILGAATVYLRIFMLGTVFVFLSFLFSVALQASGDGRTPFMLGLLVTMVNLTLDPILIYGVGPLPALGVAGAALASVIARVIMVAAGLYILVTGRAGLRFVRKGRWPRGALIRDMIAIGIPSSFRMIALSISGLVMTRLVAPFGTVALAAYTVGLSLRMFPMVVGFGLGRSAGVLVGQHLGAGKPERGEAEAWLATGIFALFMAVVGAVYFGFAPQVVSIFNSDTGVVTEGTTMLRITVLGYLPLAAALILSKALEGAGDTRAPMIITVASLFGGMIPAAYVLSTWLGWGTPGLWWAVTLGSAAHGGLMILYFRLGHWKTARILS